METLIIIVVGILITIATYLLLSNNMIQLILGAAVLTHAVHLLLMAMGGFEGDAVPIVGESNSTFVDAVPQPLTLISVVINFAVTAFLLVLAYHIYRLTNSTDLRQLRWYHYE